MPKTLTLFTAIIISFNAYAGGWQSATKVTSFTIEGSDAGERIYVGFDKVFNPDNCPNAPQLARINGDTAKGKYLFSMIMSAKAASQTVIPHYSGCDDWGRPVLFALGIQP